MSVDYREYAEKGNCHFCVISSTSPPTPSPTIGASPAASAYLILSTISVLAFLESAPMSRGHIVLLPREHAEKISDLSSEASAVLGYWLPILSRAIMNGLLGSKWEANDESWNILQANGKLAGQTINHVHFHIIPRPRPEMMSVYGKSSDFNEMLNYEKRHETLSKALETKMEDADGIDCSRHIKTAVRKEILRMKLQGKIAEGDDEWELWSVVNGKKKMLL